MQTIHNPFNFIPGDSIKWPSDDVKLQQVNSWVSDIEHVVKHVDDFTTAIQAGGACGVWPARLAGYFEKVYTVEPNRDNYACLQANVAHLDNIEHCRAGLGARDGMGKLSRDSFEDGNAGAWYTVKGNEFPIITIDSLQVASCGLIMLDVEGFELEALKGAVNTLETFRPVVVVEAKQLPHMKQPATAAGEFLESLGYKKAAKYHNDLVYKSVNC